MAQRTAVVKEIWQKEEREKLYAVFSRQRAVTGAISYGVGWITSLHTAKWWFVIVGMSSYIIIYLLWEKALKAWDIPTKLKDAVKF